MHMAQPGERVWKVKLKNPTEKIVDKFDILVTACIIIMIPTDRVVQFHCQGHMTDVSHFRAAILNLAINCVIRLSWLLSWVSIFTFGGRGKISGKQQSHKKRSQTMLWLWLVCTLFLEWVTSVNVQLIYHFRSPTLESHGQGCHSSLESCSCCFCTFALVNSNCGLGFRGIFFQRLLYTLSLSFFPPPILVNGVAKDLSLWAARLWHEQWDQEREERKPRSDFLKSHDQIGRQKVSKVFPALAS